MPSAKTNHIGKTQSNEEQTTEKLAHKNVEWFCLELVLIFGQFLCIASSLYHRHRGTQVGPWQSQLRSSWDHPRRHKGAFRNLESCLWVGQIVLLDGNTDSLIFSN